MTLLIAVLLIHGLHLAPWWYLVAAVVWAAHANAHGLLS